MSLRDQSSLPRRRGQREVELSAISLRFLAALVGAGDEGLTVGDVTDLGIWQPNVHLRLLRRAGHVVAEDAGQLVYVTGPTSTGASELPGGAPPAAPAQVSGAPVDVGPPRLFDPWRAAA